MKRNFRLSLIPAVLLSLLLHIGFETGLFLYKPKPVILNERIEMQVYEEPPKKTMPKIDQAVPNAAKQIVDQEDKALNNDIDAKAKYLSKNNQKVLKQTIAKQHGEFRNKTAANQGQQAQSKGTPPSQPLNLKNLAPQYDVVKAVKERQEREEKFDHDPEAFKRLLKQQQAQRSENKPQQAQAKPQLTGNGAEAAAPGGEASQSIDYIKDLDPGLETLLSTREFVYYTYYARMRRQLNQYWGPKVKEKLIALYRSGRQIASSSDKITRCLVTLDKEGKLVKVQIIGISGVRELDEAAVEAFKAAAPFPNPPTGMVEDDGNIKIRWDFILEV